MFVTKEMIDAAMGRKAGMQGDPCLNYADRILTCLNGREQFFSYEGNGKFRAMIAAWSWIRDGWDLFTEDQKSLAMKLIAWKIGGYPWSRAELDFNKPVVYLNLYM